MPFSRCSLNRAVFASLACRSASSTSLHSRSALSNFSRSTLRRFNDSLLWSDGPKKRRPEKRFPRKFSRQRLVKRVQKISVVAVTGGGMNCDGTRGFLRRYLLRTSAMADGEGAGPSAFEFDILREAFRKSVTELKIGEQHWPEQARKLYRGDGRGRARR